MLTSYYMCRSTASWNLTASKEEGQGWRHVRIQQNGKNASGQTHYLSLSGFEIYGTVTGVCDDLGQQLVMVVCFDCSTFFYKKLNDWLFSHHGCHVPVCYV